jgi:hypothetical protein
MIFYFIQKITALAGKFTCFEMKNGIVMAGIMGTVKVYELMTGKLKKVVNVNLSLLNKECGNDYFCSYLLKINEFSEPNGWLVKDVIFGNDGLTVTLSLEATGHRRRLSFWRTDYFSEITLLDHLQISAEEDCTFSLGMDKNFVTVFQRGTTCRIFIVSTKAKTIVDTITDSSIERVRYEQGLLIMRYPSLIRY